MLWKLHVEVCSLWLVEGVCLGIFWHLSYSRSACLCYKFWIACGLLDPNHFFLLSFYWPIIFWGGGYLTMVYTSWLQVIPSIKMIFLLNHYGYFLSHLLIIGLFLKGCLITGNTIHLVPPLNVVMVWVMKPLLDWLHALFCNSHRLFPPFLEVIFPSAISMKSWISLRGSPYFPISSLVISISLTLYQFWGPQNRLGRCQ